MISGNLSIKYGLKGPNFAIVTACTTGTHNIGDAMRLIEYGDADVMIAGGAEMSSSPTGIAGFSNARALSTRNDDPQKAADPGIKIAMVLFSVTVRVLSYWKSMNTPRPEAPISTLNWLGME